MLKHDELADPNSCLNKAKDDEPIFVLLGRDPSAPNTVRGWVSDRVERGINATEDPKIQEALKIAADIESFRREYVKEFRSIHGV